MTSEISISLTSFRHLTDLSAAVYCTLKQRVRCSIYLVCVTLRRSSAVVTLCMPGFSSHAKMHRQRRYIISCYSRLSVSELLLYDQ